MKKDPIIALSILGVILSLFIVFIIITYKPLKDIQNASLKTNSTVIHNTKFNAVDSSVFLNSVLGSTIKFSNILEWTDLRPVPKDFEYSKDGKTIGVVSYAVIELEDSLSFDESVFILNEEYKKRNNRVYTANYCVMFALDTPVSKVDSIICSYSGDSNELQEVVYTENFRSYYVPVKDFSIRYGVNEPVDMYFISSIVNFKQYPQPFMFAFLKKGTTVYFITYIPFEKENNKFVYEEVPADFLGGIINYH